MTKKSWLMTFGLSFAFTGAFVWMCKPSTECSKENFVAPDGSFTKVTIDYSSCTQQNACSFEFKCKNEGNIKAHLNAFKANLFSVLEKSQKVHAAAEKEEPENPFADYKYKLKIISLETIENPAILQTKAGKLDNEEINWYKQETIKCKDAGKSMQCIGFAPLSDHMLLEGLLDNRALKLEINIDTNASSLQMAPSGQIKVCGQFGIASQILGSSDFTTAQRIYDCSKKVQDFGGFSNSDGSIVPFNYDLFRLENSWFLVSCPTEKIDEKEKCAWLSPVFVNSNPLMEQQNKEFYFTSPENSLDNPGKSLSSIKNGRLLWSGLLEKEYNFFQAVGRIQTYDLYYFESDQNGYPGNLRIIKSIYLGKTCAPGMSGLLPVCTKITELNQQQIINTAINEYNQAKDSINACASAAGTDPALIPNAGYSWQIPSYPVLLSLTGGGQTTMGPNVNICESGSTFSDYPPGDYCLSFGNNNQYGFRAMSELPGFKTKFWSSSIWMSQGPDPNNPINAYAWVGGKDSGLNKASIKDVNSTVKNVRCVSQDW